MQLPGPRYNFTNPTDSNGNPTQLGDIAVEWFPEYWLPIRYATQKGVIVIEAAGNGSENLDDTIYDSIIDQFIEDIVRKREQYYKIYKIGKSRTDFSFNLIMPSLTSSLQEDDVGLLKLLNLR
jgi:hypothetical protein